MESSDRQAWRRCSDSKERWVVSDQLSGSSGDGSRQLSAGHRATAGARPPDSEWRPLFAGSYWLLAIRGLSFEVQIATSRGLSRAPLATAHCRLHWVRTGYIVDS